jgi:hypothetical protein
LDRRVGADGTGQLEGGEDDLFDASAHEAIDHVTGIGAVEERGINLEVVTPATIASEWPLETRTSAGAVI